MPTDREWDIYLNRIQRGELIPFLGAGACAGILPLGGELARELAVEFNCPSEIDNDLLQITTYLAKQYDILFPKEIIADRLKRAEYPDYGQPDEIHTLLAQLPLPLYMTTNYDNFMIEALKIVGKQPRRVCTLWNNRIKNQVDFDELHLATPESPIVFYFHGHIDIPSSIVVSTADYIEFLTQMVIDLNSILPTYIRKKLIKSMVWFLGYSLKDWNFQVLMGVLNKERPYRSSLAVMLPDKEMELVYNDSKTNPAKYLDAYFRDKGYKSRNKNGIDLLLMTVQEFTLEARRRWIEFQTTNS